MSKRILSLVLLLALLSPVFAGGLKLSSAGGKIVGKVIDADTKEEIIGANITIAGTSFGAATNVNGDYIIINVPPGTYTMKATYVGYKDVTVENVKVYSGLTTEQNFELRSNVLQTSDVIIVAEKPLINKNQTNSTAIIKSEDLENLPVRDVAAIVSNQAGVVRQGGNIYVRGSRSDAVAFYVDGVLVNDPLFGGNNTSIINNAIEEIQFQAGGYTAEFGGANAGIINTTLKTGSENYKFGLEVITDNFVGKGSDRKFLGGYSYGYSEYVLSLSGPIIPNDKRFKFYLAGSDVFQRSGARYWEGIDMRGIYDPSRGAQAETLDIVYPKGYRLAEAQKNNRIQGNFTADLNPFLIKVGGTYYQYHNQTGSGIGNVFNTVRTPINEGYTATGNLKFTHLLSSTMYYDINFSYYSDFFVNMDPQLKHNILAYGDSVENAKLGYTLQGESSNQTPYRLYGFQFNKYGTMVSSYEKRRNASWNIKADLFYQLGKNHEFKTGVDYKAWTIRRYALPTPFDLASFVSNNPDAPADQWYQRLDNYGYDPYGNQVDDTEGIYRAKTPVFVGAYIQDKMEFNDLVINAGIRYDYIDSDSKVFSNPFDIDFDANGIIDETKLIDVKPLSQLSPRLGFSFSLTERSKFHAQYGKFVQQTRLRDIYQGLIVVSDNIKGGYAIQSPVGFGLRPERTTSYDIGFSQQLTDNVAFDMTLFYKDIKDQVQIRNIPSEPGAQHGGYYAFVNGDFSTTKGFEFQVDMRRTERLAASLDYTYSDARGTGSNPSTGFRALWQSPTTTPYFPQQVSPLDFNQTHRGSLNLDYRFAKDDGPAALQEFGANLLVTFNSGHNFTKVVGYGNGRIPQETLNESTTPWNFQIDLKVDKSFTLGPLSANIYILVLNVLDTKNVTDVFIQTGSTNDGYLASEEGRTRIESWRSTYGDKYAQNYIDLYNAINNTNANIYGTPRQIRLGIQLDY